MTGDVLAKIKDISKVYLTEQESITVLKEISFDIRQGEFLSIIGPSGCGKTTLLRIIGGLIDSSNGKIIICEGTQSDFHTKCGFVFQDPTLLPWRTVEENILLPLELSDREHRIEWNEEIERVLKLVDLTEFKSYYPSQISGGMRQRTSIARALVQDPIILLMDEPFGALDEITRARMNFELLKLREKTGKTIIFVTHNISEAVLLSDRIIILSKIPAMIKETVDISLPPKRTKKTLESKEFYENVAKIRRLLNDTGTSEEIERCNIEDVNCYPEGIQTKKKFEDYLLVPKISAFKLYGLYIVVFFGMLAIWEAIVLIWNIPVYIVPSPQEVFSTYITTTLNGTLLYHTYITLTEAVIGFIVGAAIGILLGYPLGKSRLLEKVFSPYIVAAESAPKIALAPLVVIWLGFGIISKVFLAAIVVFFPIFVNMITGVHSVDRNQLDLMKSNGASKFEIFRKLELPSSLPILFAGFKIGVTLAVIGAVVGEFVGASAGLGYLTIYAAGRMNTPLVFTAILQLTILGILLFALMSYLEKKIIPWHYSERN